MINLIFCFRTVRLGLLRPICSLTHRLVRKMLSSWRQTVKRCCSVIPKRQMENLRKCMRVLPQPVVVVTSTMVSDRLIALPFIPLQFSESCVIDELTAGVGRGPDISIRGGQNYSQTTVSQRVRSYQHCKLIS